MTPFPGFNALLGLVPTLEAAGIIVTNGPNGWQVSDLAAAEAIVAGFANGAAELAYHKFQKQQALDDAFDQHFDLAKFIRGGTATNVTAVNVGTFLATITNNYRTLRTNISGAANVAAVDAINILSGWPANP